MAKDLRQFIETVKRLGPDYYVRASAITMRREYEVTVLQQNLARDRRSII
jgi:hypothetical protein